MTKRLINHDFIKKRLVYYKSVHLIEISELLYEYIYNIISKINIYTKNIDPALSRNILYCNDYSHF